MDYNILSNLLVISILALLNSFLQAYIVIPKIWWIVEMRDLRDMPNNRSSHKQSIPSLAGVAFFICLILNFFFIQYFDTEYITLNIIASLTIMFTVSKKYLHAI